MNIILENYNAEKFELLQKIAHEMGMKLATEEQIEEEDLQRRLELKRQGRSRLEDMKKYQGFFIINDLEAVLQ